jgi:hypothetical protein
MVYDIITASHRMQLVGSAGELTTFADYEETDDAEYELRGFLRKLEREDRRLERAEAQRRAMCGAAHEGHLVM